MKLLMDNHRFFIKRSYRLAISIIALAFLAISIGVDDCNLFVKSPPLLIAAAVTGIFAMGICAVPYVSITENELFIFLPLKKKTIIIDDITGFSFQKGKILSITARQNEKATIWLHVLTNSDRYELIEAIGKITPQNAPKMEDNNGE